MATVRFSQETPLAVFVCWLLLEGVVEVSKRLPSFRGIEAFVVAANALNLRLASEKLNISISAVSRRIQSLEEEIGTQLFVRGGRRLYLTSAGRHYHQALLPTLDAMHQITQSIESGDRGSIAIEGLPSFISCWLMPRFSKFVAQYPLATVEFSTLRKRKLEYKDIVIEPRFDADEYAGMTKLFSWESTAACRRDLINIHQIAVPSDVTKVSLLDIDAPVAPWQAWLTAAGVTPCAAIRWVKFDTFLPMVNALREGLGFSLMPWFYLVGDEQLVAPFETGAHVPGGIFLRDPTGYERPVVQRFREWLMDEIAETTFQIPSWAKASLRHS